MTHNNSSQPLVILGTPVAQSAKIIISGIPGLVIQDDGVLTLNEEALAAEISRFAQHGVSMLVGLVEDTELEPIAYEDISDAAGLVGIRPVRLPIADFQAPTPDQEPLWREIRSEALQAFKDGRSVAFHCLAGIDRSGMMAASLLAHLGMTPDEALRAIRQFRPEALETEIQLAYLCSH